MLQVIQCSAQINVSHFQGGWLVGLRADAAVLLLVLKLGYQGDLGCHMGVPQKNPHQCLRLVDNLSPFL